MPKMYKEKTKNVGEHLDSIKDAFFIGIFLKLALCMNKRPDFNLSSFKQAFNLAKFGTIKNTTKQGQCCCF